MVINDIPFDSITYTCADLSQKTKQQWSGSIIINDLETNSMDIEINARGCNFHVIIFKHCIGKCLCIPNWNICLDIGPIGETYWIWEKLIESGLCNIDSSSVACALYYISSNYQL